jgi:hypothetical protein
MLAASLEPHFVCLNYELSATSHIRFIADGGSSRDFNQGTPVVADAGQWPAIAAINSKRFCALS